MMLTDGPVRLRRVLEIVGLPQLDMERTGRDPGIEPLEDLGTGHPIVSGYLDSVRRLGHGFDAVWMGHTAAFLHVFERPLKRSSAGEDERGVEAFRSEGADGLCHRLGTASAVDDGIGAEPANQVDSVFAGSDPEDARPHPFRELHGKMTDPAAGTEDQEVLTGAELQLVLQAHQRGHAVGAERARLFGRQVGRHDRRLGLLDGHVLGVEPALVRVGVHAIAHLDSIDSPPNGHDGSGPIVSQYFGEALLAEVELARSDRGIPSANPRGLEPDENLFAPRLRDGKDVRSQDFRTAMTVDRGSLHGLGNEWIHRQMLYPADGGVVRRRTDLDHSLVRADSRARWAGGGGHDNRAPQYRDRAGGRDAVGNAFLRFLRDSRRSAGDAA